MIVQLLGKYNQNFNDLGERYYLEGSPWPMTKELSPVDDSFPGEAGLDSVLFGHRHHACHAAHTAYMIRSDSTGGHQVHSGVAMSGITNALTANQTQPSRSQTVYPIGSPEANEDTPLLRSPSKRRKNRVPVLRRSLIPRYSQQSSKHPGLQTEQNKTISSIDRPDTADSDRQFDPQVNPQIVAEETTPDIENNQTHERNQIVDHAPHEPSNKTGNENTAKASGTKASTVWRYVSESFKYWCSCCMPRRKTHARAETEPLL
jgi:hypothetical protein